MGLLSLVDGSERAGFGDMHGWHKHSQVIAAQLDQLDHQHVFERGKNLASSRISVERKDSKYPCRVISRFSRKLLPHA